MHQLNELEAQLRQTQELLKANESQSNEISSLRIQRNILAVLTLLFLGGFILYYVYQNKNKSSMLTNENLSLVDKDSLNIYKEGYFTALQNATVKATQKSKSLNDEKVVYSVQIGAFKEFYLTSEGLMNLSEYQADGYNKMSIGNYKTYAEAKTLKDSLNKLGFKGCFLSARSFGKPIDIREALVLSNEPEFLEQ